MPKRRWNRDCAVELMTKNKQGCLLFDWGDTLMRVFPDFDGPMTTWPKVEMIPDAREVLEELCSTWTIALATNAQDSTEDEIREALALVGLHALIDEVYCYQRIGVKKPSRAFFQYIFDELAIDATDAVMIGDSYAADVEGALAMGMRAIWFNPRSDEDRAGEMVRTVHSLKELPDVLKAWDAVGE